jgi:hypothetical protein
MLITLDLRSMHLPLLAQRSSTWTPKEALELALAYEKLFDQYHEDKMWLEQLKKGYGTWQAECERKNGNDHRAKALPGWH